MNKTIRRLFHTLFLPTNSASLAIFRIGFGLMMMVEVCRYFYHDWITKYWVTPAHHFTYWPFDFIHPLPGNGMTILFTVMLVLSVCITIGFFYRIAIALFFVAISYTFLLEQARYLNHMYFICLLSFVLIFTDAHRHFSVDRAMGAAGGSAFVPAWQLFLIRFMVALPYFFGGIAKLGPDWLMGEPLRTWLAEDLNALPGPLAGHTEPIIFLLSAGGMLFDLFIVPLLLWRRTRSFAFVLAIVFNVVNHFLFHIGIFPWLMIVATTIFFSSDWPLRLLNRKTDQAEVKAQPLLLKSIICCLLLCWFLLHLVMPLRHFFIPGQVHWNEAGHQFAWHMKLRSKVAEGNFFAINRSTGAIREIFPSEYLTSWQEQKMMGHPDMIWQFAGMVRQHYLKLGLEVEVHAGINVSLNGKPFKPFVHPSTDLTKADRPGYGACSWILP